MSYEFYKILHILGIAAVITGLVGLIYWTPATTNGLNASKKGHFIYHGLGLLIILVSGFGMLAKLGILSGLPNWVIAKLIIWLALGGIVVLIKRKPNLASYTKIIIVFAVFLSAYLAISKPF